MNMLKSAEFDEDLSTFVTPERLDNLRGRIVDRGQEDLDVRWFTHETPIGPLLVAARGNSILRVAFEREEFAGVQEDLMSRLGTRSLRSDRGFEYVRKELDEYFGGNRTSFSAPVDFTLTRAPFRALVQRQLPRISYGTTWSYGELAESVGRPAAVRAAASACATNPLPILVPCHRVVRADGSTGAYLGGAETKRWLLHHEHAR